MTWQGQGPSGYFFTINIDPSKGSVDWEPPRGDVSGLIDRLIVIGLQSTPVAQESPVVGQVLGFTNGKWRPVNVSGVANPHELLSLTHTDTTPASPVAGDVIVASGSPALWVKLAVGNASQVLTVAENGTNVLWRNSNFQTTTVITSGTSILWPTQFSRVIINKVSGSPTTVNLPVSPFTGQEIVIKDGKGDADDNRIAVLSSSGISIDGLPQVQIRNNYGAYTFLYNGDDWNII